MADPVADLVFMNGPRVGQAVSLTAGTTRAGRDAELPVSFPDKLASRVHCVFELGASGLTCSDENSSNGVHVNGERVASATLYNGDTVLLGETSLLVRCPWHRAGPPDPSANRNVPSSSEITRRITRGDLVGRKHEQQDAEEEFRYAVQLLCMMDLGRALTRETERPVIQALVEAKLKPVFQADRCVHVRIEPGEAGAKLTDPEDAPSIPPSVLNETLEVDRVQTWSSRDGYGMLVGCPYHATGGKVALCVIRPRKYGPFDNFERAIGNALSVSLGLVGSGELDTDGQTVTLEPPPS